ncbi:outer membrane receptor for ferrienterochelin and colicins [Parapedobacter luteus]|uniref:Outer membrane receptor for ferrienterochelin and colicins n=1 Tax=Parapedobacter luteus TaxID=623280 RepID=A0A1T5DZU9_9SPHI|nr:TonB-dependent receptor [Parapedobacter luteus]SKB77204.1 outer membrane receptor for ferrienterochelin and colicins [Parapedobacter luteus]
MERLILCMFCVSAPYLLCAQATPPLWSNDSLRVNTLDEVVVTGQYEPQSIKNSVYRVRTINNNQIRLRAATSVENILNTQLGMRFSNDLTLGESDIQLMGMSGQNVKVLVDGIPLIDRGATKQSLSQIDVNNIDRIEVVEGPMSVIYGTDALAGVINIITKKGLATDNLLISARVQEESAGSEYKAFSNEGMHNGNLTVNWQHKGWLAQASGSRNNFGGWKGNSSGRALDWNPKSQWLASGTLGYRNEALDMWYRLDYLDEDIYTPGPLNQNTGRAVDKNYLSSRYTHVLQAQWNINERFSFTGSASYQDYERRTRTIRHDFRTGTSELTTGAGEQDIAGFTSAVFRSTLQYKLSDKVFFQPGIEINSNDGSGQRISGNPRINDYALFISSEIKPTGWMNIRPGLRFVKNSVYDAPPAIPSLNTKFRLSESFDIRAAYARGFRAPALRELYFTFFDANHSITGNENLKAEYSNSFNTYVSWYGNKWGAWRITSTLGGFYNDFNDQIAVGVDPENPSANTYINIEKYRTAGGTLENAIFWKNMEANIGFSYIGRYNRLSETEANVPPMAWSPEVNSNIMYYIPKWGAGISLFYKFNGKRPSYEAVVQTDGTVMPRRAAVASYHNADVSLNKNITRYVTLVGGVRNLFDVTRIESTSLVGDGAHSSAASALPVGYGRSFFLGLHMQWSKN